MPDVQVQLMTVQEVADVFRVSDQTVYRWVDTGTLTALRVGGTIRIRREAVDGLLAAAETKPEDAA
jgi:excisionase family DNA binding protein